MPVFPRERFVAAVAATVEEGYDWLTIQVAWFTAVDAIKLGSGRALCTTCFHWAHPDSVCSGIRPDATACRCGAPAEVAA